ncbi:MAG: septation protein SpoVG family protein [Elusimicrobia bacterium]|nr:septation protein SpoVG family protein [Elusimicrobiota bacterium]
MEITEVRVTLRNEEKLKAFVTVTFDKCFAVRNMKIVQGDKGPMLCMPSRKLPDGTFKDVAHPINAEFRAYLEKQIFNAYEEEMQKNPLPSSAAVSSQSPASS